MKIIIENFKCPSWNLFYSGTHWSKRKKLVDEIHQIVYYLSKKNKLKPFKNKVAINFEIYYRQARLHDPDNACIKPFIDGLVMSGILKDDNYHCIDEISIRIKQGKENKIIIKIYE